MATPGDKLNQAGDDLTSKMEGLSASMRFTIGNVDMLGERLKVSSKEFYSLVEASNQFEKSLSQNKDMMDKIVSGEMDLAKAKEIARKSQEKRNKMLKQAENLQKKLDTMHQRGSRKQKQDLKDQINLLVSKAKTEKKHMDTAVSTAQKGQSKLSRGLSGIGRFLNNKVFQGAGKGFEGMAAGARKAKVGMKGATGFMGKFMVLAKSFARANIFGLIISAVAFIVKAVLQINQEVAQIGRNLGISADQARKVRQHFVNVAADAARLGIEYTDILDAQQALNSSLGTSATMISGDILIGMAELTKRMKLSTEAAVGFGKIALATRKTTEQITKATIEGANAAAKDFGVRIEFPKLLETVGRISGRVRLIFADNMKLMGETVASAQLLGLTMKDIEASQSSLLNFQTSIEKEMKAELFLGRQINLERARLAALTNDFKTLTEEITREAGDYVDFMSMNALQQNSIAEALGMSADQMADMLLQQADLNALKQKALEQGKDEIAANLSQMSVQEAFLASMEKLKIIVINMLGKIEDFELSRTMSALLGFGFKRTKLFDGMTEKMEGIGEASSINKDTSIYGDNQLTGQAIPITNDFSLGGLKLRTNPLDTFTLVGGTAMDGRPANPPMQQENQMNSTFVVRQEKWDTVNFDFDTTKFSY